MTAKVIQPSKPSGFIEIDPEKCKGCYLCIPACPPKLIHSGTALNKAGYYPAIPGDMTKCTACGLCWQVCPDAAITVYQHIHEEAS
ncbi:MAG: 4Fe-4S binding protein [Candidatus Hydrogenedentes bacterium]|nr:4Fe-4S binding protein [Candidatus Hydrogenedentota bacterium]